MFAGQWLNANISCRLMEANGSQICCFTLKNGPIPHQIVTIHCLFSYCSIRKWSMFIYVYTYLQPGKHQYDIIPTLKLPTLSMMSGGNSVNVNDL